MNPVGENRSEYCTDTSVFYENPINVLEEQYSREGLGPFDVHIPAGWVVSDSPEWVEIDNNQPLPHQGWKIHVSATINNAQTVLTSVSRLCFEEQTAFKFVPDRATFMARNAKYAPRSSSGKFITIYPANDDKLKTLVHLLEHRIGGREGPYILTDLRWNKGPIYLRYGGFEYLECQDEHGDTVPAIRNHEGELVPDSRGTEFTLPDFAPRPHFLKKTIEERLQPQSATGSEFPYSVRQALHFSNSGGVYLADHIEIERAVVLKEARPHTGIDTNQGTARDRLENERFMLERLHDMPQIPQFISWFDAWEHTFLAEEYIEGVDLYRWVANNYPFSRYTDTADYTRRARRIIAELDATVTEMHHRGVYLRDLQPRNVLIDKSEHVHLVDFETACIGDLSELPPIATPGFIPKKPCTSSELDTYGLAQTAMHIFSPITPISDISADVWNSQIKYVADQFGTETTATLNDLWEQVPTRLNGHDNQYKAYRPSTFDLDELIAKTIRGIETTRDNTSTTQRRYPGDITQFSATGMANVSSGAAGVALILSRAGRRVGDDAAWIADQLRKTHPTKPGLMRGTTGIAATLSEIDPMTGWEELLQDTFAGDDLTHGDLSLYSGLSGVTLGLLSMRCNSASQVVETLLDQAIHHMSQELTAPRRVLISTASTSHVPAGLWDGWTGVALACIALGNTLQEEKWYEKANWALEQDLNKCTPLADGSLQIDDASRMMPYLAEGSAGIAFALSCLPTEYLGKQQINTLRKIRRACEARSYANSGLLKGRAGTLATLATLPHAAFTERSKTDVLDEQVKFLHLHAFHETYHDGVVYAGDECQKLSADYETGAAGVLAALLSVRQGTPQWLPVSNPNRILHQTGNDPAQVQTKMRGGVQ